MYYPATTRMQSKLHMNRRKPAWMWEILCLGPIVLLSLQLLAFSRLRRDMHSRPGRSKFFLFVGKIELLGVVCTVKILRNRLEGKGLRVNYYWSKT